MTEVNLEHMKKDSELIATIKVCIISFAFACMTASIAGDVFRIWLGTNVGLDSKQIGELFAMKAMFAIFYKPVFGYLLDKFQLKKTFIIIIPILGMLVGPFFEFVYEPLIKNPNTFYLGGILGGLFFGFVIIAGGAAVFNYTDRYIRAHGGTYGKVSAFNVAGWGFMGLTSSILYNINPDYNFYLASFFGFVVLVTVISLKTDIFSHMDNAVVSKEKIKIKNVFPLLININFFVLISFVIFCTAISYIQQYQLGGYTATFWDTKKEAVKMIGYLAIPFSLTAFVVSAFSSRMINYVGCNKGIIFISLSFIAFLLIAGYAGFIHSRAVIIGARFISATSNPLFNVIILAFIAHRFDTKVNGVIYLVGFHFVNNLGVTYFGPKLGAVFDKSGFAQGYVDLAIISSIGLLVTISLMKVASVMKKKQQNLESVVQLN